MTLILIAVMHLCTTLSLFTGSLPIDFDKDQGAAGGKFKCFSTYELVQIETFDIHYDER